LFKSIFDLMIEPLGFKKKYKFSKSSEVLWIFLFCLC
jgi:hypothetical protein